MVSLDELKAFEELVRALLELAKDPDCSDGFASPAYFLEVWMEDHGRSAGMVLEVLKTTGSHPLGDKTHLSWRDGGIEFTGRNATDAVFFERGRELIRRSSFAPKPA